MLRVRVMPALLLRDGGLVKTVRFKRGDYIGDPINTARIFNEMEVDELMLLDVGATARGREPQFDVVERLVSECFMPIAFGGGVRTGEHFERLFRAGVEKVSVSSLLFDSPATVRAAVARYGAQSVLATLDVKRARFGGGYQVLTHNGSKRRGSLAEAVDLVESLGVGEVVVNSIDRDGTWSGFETDAVRQVADRLSCPVVALGGAGGLQDIGAVVRDGHASAVAVGSLAVFQARGMGVLVNFPTVDQLKDVLP